MDKNEFLTKKLLNKEITDKNQTAIEIMTNYSIAANLIARTQIAMGRKPTFKISISSTVNEKLNRNVFASTH